MDKEKGQVKVYTADIKECVIFEDSQEYVKHCNYRGIDQDSVELVAKKELENAKSALKLAVQQRDSILSSHHLVGQFPGFDVQELDTNIKLVQLYGTCVTSEIPNGVVQVHSDHWRIYENGSQRAMTVLEQQEYSK